MSAASPTATARAGSPASPPGSSCSTAAPPAPTISSLRESGQLEQDADVIALLYRIGDAADATRHLYVAKNKTGRLGRMALRFDGDRQRFNYIAPPSIPRELETEARKRRDRERSGEQISMEEVPK